MNLLPAKVVGADGAGVVVALPSGAKVTVPAQPGTVQPGEDVTLGIRPESLRPDPNGPLAGNVRLVERLGGLTLLHVALDGGEALTVQIEGSDATQARHPIRLSFDPAACHLFDGAGLSLARLARHPLAA